METPYANLRQLAGIIQKPSTPPLPSTNPPSSNKRSGRKAPGSRTLQPSADTIQRPTPGRRTAQASTPHVIRALQQRKAGQALRPDRRRSGRVQRETPRDNLRSLSRLLAPESKSFEPSPSPPQVADPASEHKFLDDLDREADPPRPRLSMPLEEDSPQMLPPVLSESLIEENTTETSIELPRRAPLGQASRRSRGSFGSIRLSDRFVDLAELGLGGQSSLVDEDSLPVPAFGEDMVDTDEDEGFGLLAANEDSAAGILPGNLMDGANQSLLEVDTRSMANNATGGNDDDVSFVFDVVPEQSGLAVEGLATNDHGKGGKTAEPTLAENDYRKSLKTRPAKEVKTSKFGIACPSLPITTIKKMASNFAKSSSGRNATLSKEAIIAISQASDWFFEQISDDLAAYAEHAGRKTIEESDVNTLMKRQRQLTANTTPFSLAQKFLPGELLHDIHMAEKAKPWKRKRLSVTDADEDSET
ncbi:MAG: hypothetical protein M1814_006282 [Vezdaea aestivalis]|nr:MAG: hypothetical protein M1814_006282 [Vezdaea aestivalis]